MSVTRVVVLLLAAAAVWLGWLGRREADRRAERALLDALHDRGKLQTLEPQLAAMRRDQTELAQALVTAQGKLSESLAAQEPLRRTVERLSGERIQQGAKLEELVARIAALDEMLAQARKRQDESDQAIAEQRAELDRRTAALETTERQRQEAEKKLAATTADLAAARDAAQRAATECERLNAQQRALETRQTQLEQNAQQALAGLREQEATNRLLLEQVRFLTPAPSGTTNAPATTP